MYRRLSQKPNPVIFLATPLGKDGKMSIGTANFCSFIDERPNVTWGHARTCSPELSRNILIEDHLENSDEWSHVLFIDSDIAPKPDALDKLLDMQVAVASGIYPLNLEGGLYWNISTDGEKLIPIHEDLPSDSEPFNVKVAGAGLLLIRKEVLVMIGWPYFKMSYQPKYENDGVSIKQGEDTFFCRRVTEMGYEIKAHPLVECGHTNPLELLEMYKKLKLQIETKHAKTATV